MFKKGHGAHRSTGHKVALLGKGPSDGKRQGQMSTGMQRMLSARVGLLGNSPADNMNTGLYQDAQNYEQSYKEPNNFDQYSMEDNSGYMDNRSTDRMSQYERNMPQSLLSQTNMRAPSLLEGNMGRNVPVSQSDDMYYEDDYGNQEYGTDHGGQDWGAGDDQYDLDYGRGSQQHWGGSQLGSQSQQHRGGILLDTPANQHRGSSLQGSQGQQHRRGGLLDLQGQQKMGGGFLDASDQQHRGDGFQDSPISQRRGGSLLDAPVPHQRGGGFQDSPINQDRGGGLLDSLRQQQMGGSFQDSSIRRGGGLLDSINQEGFGYSDMDDDRNSFVGNNIQGRNFGGLGDDMRQLQDSQDSLLGQSNHGMHQGFQQNQMSFGRQQRVDRQTDLLQKADLQIRMIEEEKIEQERRQRESMQQNMGNREGQGLSREMQALLETQQQALMLQQKEKLNRMGGGLLGDGPGSQQNLHQLASNQQRGSIPSLLDMGGGQRRPLLGKRPSATQTKAAQVAKRARQESQISRNKPISKSRQSPPQQRRRRGGSRRSRVDDKDSSKSRDRKDSAKDSNKSPNKQQNNSGSPRKDQDRSRRESKSEKVTKDTTQVNVTAGNQKDHSKPTKDTQEKNKEDDIQITGIEESGHQSKEKTEKQDAGKGGEGEEKDKTRDKSLTVTVSKKGRSVNDSDAKPGEPEREVKYTCNVCDVKCYDELSFSRHMKGMKHSKRMETLESKANQTTPVIAARKKAEEHLRQLETKTMTNQSKSSSQRKPLEGHCKVCNEKFTGAYKDHKDVPKHQARENRSKAGCKTCNVSTFLTYQDFIKHLDSDWHKKKLKQESWPECKICNQKFKSPRKFVLHCKTDHHIENKKKKGTTDDDLDDLKDLVTLDTVGFEEENPPKATSAKEPEKKKEPDPVPTSAPVPTKVPTKVEETKTAPRKSVEVVDEEVLGEYDPNVAVGQRFVVPVSGFFCKLCHKFYNNESAAKGTHCQSQTHFEKYQKIMMAKMMSKKLAEEAMTKPNVMQENKTVSIEKVAVEEKKGTEAQKQDNTEQEVKTEPAVKDVVSNTTRVDNQENGTDKNSHLSNTTNKIENMDTSGIENNVDDNEIRIDVYPESKDSPKRGSGPRARRGRGRGVMKK